MPGNSFKIVVFACTPVCGEDTLERLERETFNKGDRLIGTLVTLSSPEIAEMLAEIGFDWLFIDAEHGAFDPAAAQPLLQAVGGRCPCAIRVPGDDEVWIKKALDIGAAGVIVPQVNSAEQAERIVRRCKYSPQGTRGVGVARAHGFGLRFQETMDRANEEIAVIVQAEHADAVRDIESIVQVEGIDCVLVGPYDLSASLGRIGEVTHPEVLEAIATVRDACKDANVSLGAFGVTAEAVRPFIEQGFSLIAVGVDTLLLAGAATEVLAAVKD